MRPGGYRQYQPHVLRGSRLTDMRFSCPNSADRQRWSTAPAARTVPRIDWNERLGVSCNRLLDGGRPMTSHE